MYFDNDVMEPLLLSLAFPAPGLLVSWSSLHSRSSLRRRRLLPPRISFTTRSSP